MFSKVIEEGLTYGQAMDKCIHEGKKVSRAHWGGYWERIYIEHEKIDMSLDMIVAVLKDNGGFAPATAYNEDKFAKDWRVVE